MKKHTYTVTHQQFLRFVVVVTFALAAIILVTCLLYTIVILQRNQTYVDIMLDQYETSVDTQMEEYTQLVQTAAYDASVRNYLQAEEPYARYLAGQEVSTLFSNLKMVQNGVADFYLFERDDPSTAYVDLGAQQSALMERLWQCAKPEVLGIYAYTPSYGQARADFVILAGCPVYSLTVDGPQSRVIGAVVVAINRLAIESNLREFYQLEGMRYALLDQQQRVILGRPLTVSQQDYRLACEQGDVAHNTLTSSTILTSIPAMDAVLVVQIDKLVLLEDLFTITLLVLALTLCLLGAMLYMSGRISREVTMPLSSLTEAVKQMDADPTHTRQVPEEGNADFRMLSASLNRMLKTEKRLTNELLEANRNLYASELAQKHLELQFLRSQINPHFLYNTLETIRSIALVRKVPEVAEAAKNLAKLLRYSIKGGEVMQLSSELEIIRCYLSIQELRFGSRMYSVFRVEEAAQDLYIPRMCLQPLVENAVVHGLETAMGPGMLIITCRKDEQLLWVTVQDTGVGMPTEEVERINRQLANPFSVEVAQNGGIGMLNVARRLQLSLGGDFVMRVESELNRGTIVTLRMPLSKLNQTGGDARV